MEICRLLTHENKDRKFTKETLAIKQLKVGEEAKKAENDLIIAENFSRLNRFEKIEVR